MINEISISNLYDEYNKMLNSNEYISKKKYDEFIDKYKEIISFQNNYQEKFIQEINKIN